MRNDILFNPIVKFLIFADCNLEERVKESVAECMYNTGQSCDAPTRLLVEKSCYNKVLKIAKRAAENTAIGNPEDEGSHIGPLFDKIQHIGSEAPQRSLFCTLHARSDEVVTKWLRTHQGILVPRRPPHTHP